MIVRHTNSELDEIIQQIHHECNTLEIIPLIKPTDEYICLSYENENCKEQQIIIHKFMNVRNLILQQLDKSAIEDLLMDRWFNGRHYEINKNICEECKTQKQIFSYFDFCSHELF